MGLSQLRRNRVAMIGQHRLISEYSLPVATRSSVYSGGLLFASRISLLRRQNLLEKWWTECVPKRSTHVGGPRIGMQCSVRRRQNHLVAMAHAQFLLAAKVVPCTSQGGGS